MRNKIFLLLFAVSVFSDLVAQKSQLFLLAGQSNAVGPGDSTKSVICEPGTAYEYVASTNECIPLKDPIGRNWKLFQKAGTGSVAPAFARRLNDLTGSKIYIVTAARGGASCNVKGEMGNYGTWDVTGNNLLFADAVTKTQMAVRKTGTALSGIIWMQGERDANAILNKQLTADEFQQSLESLIIRFRKAFGKKLPFYIVLTGNQTDKTTEGSLAVQNAQKAVASQLNNVYIAYSETPNFPQKNWLKDNVHYKQEALNEIGEKVAETVFAKNMSSCFAHTIKTSTPNEILWYSQPAKQWLQALPIGNGTLGGMIFGGVEKEQIQFNESSLITGTTSINGNEKPTVGYYQPFGDILIDFGNLRAENYRRELNLENAIHSVSFETGGVNYLREYFSSFPDKVLVANFSANKKAKITFTLKLKDAHNGKIEVCGNKIIATGMLPENSMQYESQVIVLNSGGVIKSENASITVSNANQATILLVAGTDFSKDFYKDFKGEQPHAQLEKILALAAAKTYTKLRKAHITDYKTLYSRVQLNLGTTPEKSTSDRLTAVKNGEKDPALEALLFQYGRYLLISSSRAGGLPANLQGIWNNEYKPAWYSQYTTNINVEMNYWPAEPTGLSECTAPYFDWVENLARVNKKTTDPKLQTKRGWIAYSTNNIMGGPSTWGLHRPGSAWMSQHFWEHYSFTGDKDFLKNRAYPMLKDVSGYWEDHLVERKDGKLITPDGWSPEHGPGLVEGDRTPYPGVTYDQQIVYDLFSNVVDAAAELNSDSDYKNKIDAMRNRLLGPQIGKWGQLQEWMEDWDSPNDKHRHNSHMFGLHPGRQISPITTPEWANAALVSLNARGDVSTGWSTAWKINLFARLGLGNRSYNMINMLFKKCILENMFDTHPPFQMDGNFGYTAGVAEMLVQSHLKTEKGYLLQVLPALPDAWLSGEVKGLRARGGFVVDLQWTNGKLSSCKIKSLLGNNLNINYKGKTTEQKTSQGKSYTFMY